LEGNYLFNKGGIYLRKLASIRTIKELNPIPGADKIETALVDGWTVVVQKELHETGDRIVFVEVDAILPDIPEFEFMRPRGFRVKTIRLMKQLSQGLIFPMSILDGKKFKTDDRENPTYGFYAGADVTELLGIVKYEPKVSTCLSGIAKGAFPSFIPKTDEERIQNVLQILEEFKGEQFYVTEKLDGTSMTCYLKDGEFGVCSRNLDLERNETNLYWKVARKHCIETKLRDYFNDTGIELAVQGELIGSGVHGNKYGFVEGDNEFRLYNVYNITFHRYLCYGEVMDFARSLFHMVPIILHIKSMNHTLESILDLADGTSVMSSDTLREGIVVRPMVERFYPPIGRLSFKVVSNKFLEKNKE
jgi:RNA ligase (TIGR02306 family)